VGFPERIGRYEIVAELASGGMAEILLARLVGPNGFERPVVIKRILPHLAREPSFVDMFLDEARIVAGIRHPNVVQVQELGHDGGELFLAMEYLDGESVASLMKRLVAKGERLAPELAAHVVAQACAGLHAAHELTGADGAPMHLVHRDVSPQNLIVTYGGLVKVVDFGIAKAADRITRTETGIVKGKHEYMSPEQCLGKSLDRRSDVFSLGVVLYELLAGKRLFRRDSQMATFQAICVEPLVPLAAAAPWIDPLLQRITTRALARQPAERFATAGEMRRELLEAMHALGVGPDPDEDLAALLRRLFGDRIEEKAEMLRSVQAGTQLAVVPRSETDLAVDVPAVGGAPPPPRRRRRTVGVALGVGVVAVAAVVALAAARWRAASAPPNASSSSSPSAPSATAVPPTAPLAIHVSNVHRITFGGGCDEFPSLAPDGKTLVYDTTVGADSHLVVMDVDTKATRALTDVRGWDFAAQVSPDGRQVAFLREVGGVSGTFVVGLEGGEPRKLVEGITRPSWYADGRSVWAGTGSPLVRVDATTGATLEQVEPPSGQFILNSLPLLDGSLVLRVMDANHHGMGADGLWLATRDRSKSRWLLHLDIEEAMAEWPTGGHVLMGAGNDADSTDLTDVPLDGSPITRMKNEVRPHKGLVVSRDMRRLVWSSCHSHNTLVRRRGDAMIPVFGTQEWSDWEIAWLRGTRDLAIISSRSGLLQPWIVNLDGARAPRMLPTSWEPHSLAATADGKMLLLGGGRGIVAMRADGAEPPRALTLDPTDAEPRALRDGSTVLFTRLSAGSARVMSVPMAGGEVRPFLEEETRLAVQSPSDDRIVFMAGTMAHALTPMLLDPRTGQSGVLSSELMPATYGPAHFSVDGRRVAIVSGSQEIVEVDLATRRVVRSSGLDGVAVAEYAGSEMLLVAMQWTGHLWLADIEEARASD
jgi:serine/threonine protein kinase